MRIHRLKGWSKQELEHAQAAFVAAESRKHPHLRHLEHMHTGLLIVLTSLAGVGFTVLLTPVLLFGNTAVTVSLMLLLGACIGLLYAHNESQDMLGFVVMALLSYIGVLAVANVLGFRIPGMGLAYLVGMIAAYMERRYHGLA